MRKGILLFTLVFLALLALDVYPGLRGGAGWRWTYTPPERWTQVIILAAALAIYLAGVIAVRRRSVPVWIGLGWSVGMGAVIAVCVVGVRGDAGFLLFTRTVSPVQTGASALAVRIMARDGLQSTLENWTGIMREARESNLIHFTTSPPGQPLFHYVAAELLQNIPVISQPISMLLRPYQCSDLEVMRYTRGELTSAALGMLMPLWAALAVIPVYWAARMLISPLSPTLPPNLGEEGLHRLGWASASRTETSHTEKNPPPSAGEVGERSSPRGGPPTALYLAQWYPLIPTILLFAPTWNTLYPLLCVTSFALLLAGLKRELGVQSAVFCLLSGAVMSVTTFLNFAVLPVLLVFGLFTLGYGLFARRGVLPGRPYNGVVWAVRAGLWFGLGLASLWLVFGLASGLTPLDLLRVTFEEHTDLVQRAYLPWLVLHPYDVVMFVGFPLAGMFLWRVWSALTPIRAPSPVNEESKTRHGSMETPSPSTGREFGWGYSSPIDLLALSMFLTLVLVNLSGVVQGENGRILSFYAPFLLLAGGRAMWNTRPGVGAWRTMPLQDIPLFTAQALMALVMAAVLDVVPLDLNPQPTAPRQDVPHLETAELRPVNAVLTSDHYAGVIQLEAHRFIPDLAAQAVTLETIWRGVEQVERPYYFELVAHAENAVDGKIVTEPYRWYAQNGNYLPTCWRKDDRIHDVIVLSLPPVSAPVVWTLELRAMDERTGDVMRVTYPDGTTGDVVLLDPVNYP